MIATLAFSSIRLSPIENDRLKQLLTALEQVPADLRLVPTYNRTPILPSWQHGMERSQLIDVLRRGAPVQNLEGKTYTQYLNGYAALTGSGLVGADFDGRSALTVGAELAASNGGMPATPGWKGAKGQSALYRLPGELADRIAKLDQPIRKLKIKEGCVQNEAIELLYEGCSITLPPSWHPKTDDGYQWLGDGQADFSLPIAIAPRWICEVFEAECAKQEYWASQPKQPFTGKAEAGDVEAWLKAVHPDTLDYDGWIKVGMAIKSALPDNDGLDLWDGWSQTGSSYKPRDCESRWDGFIAGRVPVAYLARLAGFELAAVMGAGVGFVKSDPTRTEEQITRDRLISKRMMVYRSNYKEAIDRASFLGETPESQTVWYEGRELQLDLKAAQTSFLVGGLGSGKTEKALRAIGLPDALPKLGVVDSPEDAPTQAAMEAMEALRIASESQQYIWIAPRKQLLRNTGARAEAMGIRVYDYQDDVGHFREMLRSGQPGVYMFCPEGLSPYHTINIAWGKAIVIFDEFASIQESVPSANSEIFAEVERCFREAGTLVAIDAQLSDVDVKILEMYRSGSRKFYRQIKTQSAKKVAIGECYTKDGLASLSHDGVQYAWMEEYIAAGKSFVLAASCKIDLKTAQLHCQKLLSELAIATSETVEFNKRLFPMPDLILEGEKISQFGYSPVAQSGLDIQTPFDKGLLLYKGNIPPQQALQMMGRPRNCLDWTISAPRRSLNPAISFNALTPDRIERTSGALAQTLSEMNERVSLPGVVWGNLQRQLNEIHGAFATEELYCHLEREFEAIETIELTANQELHKEYCKQVKADEARLTLAGDIERGRELERRKLAPATDADVWAIEAARLADLFPDLWATAIATTDQEGAIELICVLRSRRIDRLKNYTASLYSPDEEIAALLARMRKKAPNPSSRSFRHLQDLKIHRILKLDKLARARGKAIAHETHFDVQSPEVAALYEQFKGSRELKKLFPGIESITDFWAIVRNCMIAMGYQSAGKDIRVASNEPVRNGKKRDGSQRYSNSRSSWFSGWKPMAESGSEFFQSIFPALIEALRDRLAKEQKSTLKDDPLEIAEAA